MVFIKYVWSGFGSSVSEEAERAAEHQTITNPPRQLQVETLMEVVDGDHTTKHVFVGSPVHGHLSDVRPSHQEQQFTQINVHLLLRGEGRTEKPKKCA